MTSQSRNLRFTGSQGEELAAYLDLPAGTPRAYALFAHCLTRSKDTLATARISRALTNYGIAVLRFDFTGLGAPGGEFADASFGSSVDDLVCAADYLRTDHAAPTILIGHSLGGAAVLAGRHRLPEVRAVATIGAPADQPQADRIRELDAALLVLHSPTDEMVDIDNARMIFDTARHPKSFVAIDGADHLLTRRADASYVAAVLAAWADRHTDAPDATPEPNSTEPGQVIVSEDGGGRYGQRVTVGRHTLAADEPEPIGADSGPSPYDLLLAALGTCTSMTLRMYAQRKQWPLQNVTVSLRHDKIHAEDCAECETRTGKLDRIERVIDLDGPLDHDQQRRLLEIADKCPVHRTLRSEIIIETRPTSPVP